MKLGVRALSQGVQGRSNIHSLCSLPIPPGVYEHGLLTVFSEDLPRDFLRSWEWLLPARDGVPLAMTSFGDIFYWSDEGEAVLFLEVQKANREFVDHDIRWFVEEFLSIPGVMRDVLHCEQFEEVRGVLGDVGYLDCFILEPWALMGGQNRVENYTKGRADVYIDLVGQFCGQISVSPA